MRNKVRTNNFISYLQHNIYVLKSLTLSDSFNNIHKVVHINLHCFVGLLSTQKAEDCNLIADS